MTANKRTLILRQSLELILDEVSGGAAVYAPGKPTTLRVTPGALAEYRDQVMVGVDKTTGEQVDLTGMTLDGAWLYVENLGDTTTNTGELGIWDGDPTGAGNELGTCQPGERFGPIRLGADWGAIWLKGDSGLSKDVNARVVLIEA